MRRAWILLFAAVVLSIGWPGACEELPGRSDSDFIGGLIRGLHSLGPQARPAPPPVQPKTRLTEVELVKFAQIAEYLRTNGITQIVRGLWTTHSILVSAGGARMTKSGRHPFNEWRSWHMVFTTRSDGTIDHEVVGTSQGPDRPSLGGDDASRSGTIVEPYLQKILVEEIGYWMRYKIPTEPYQGTGPT